jgi:hypothetical protein
VKYWEQNNVMQNDDILVLVKYHGKSFCQRKQQTVGTEIQKQDLRRVTGRLSHTLNRNFLFTIPVSESKSLSAVALRGGKRNVMYKQNFWLISLVFLLNIISFVND